MKCNKSPSIICDYRDGRGDCYSPRGLCGWEGREDSHKYEELKLEVLELLDHLHGLQMDITEEDMILDFIGKWRDK